MGCIFRRSSQQQQQRRRRRRRKRSIEYRPAVCSKYTYKRPENDTRRAFCCWDDTLCRMVAARGTAAAAERAATSELMRSDGRCAPTETDATCVVDWHLCAWPRLKRPHAVRRPTGFLTCSFAQDVHFESWDVLSAIRVVSFGWKKINILCCFSFRYSCLYWHLQIASFFSLCLLRAFVYIFYALQTSWHASDLPVTLLIISKLRLYKNECMGVRYVPNLCYMPTVPVNQNKLSLCTWIKQIDVDWFRLFDKIYKTRMWANAQRDGRPAEHRWRPLFNAAKFGWRPLLDVVQ